MLHSSGAPVINARTGRHDCWDRLVIDFNGTPAPGYDVRYVDAFHEGNLNSGAILPLAGGAVVRLRAFAPANVPWHYGDHIKTSSQFRSAGYRTFRHLAYRGSDGLNTGLAVGLRARLPFRLFILTRPGNTSRLVMDVAHRWS